MLSKIIHSLETNIKPKALSNLLLGFYSSLIQDVVRDQPTCLQAFEDLEELVSNLLKLYGYSLAQDHKKKARTSKAFISNSDSVKALISAFATLNTKWQAEMDQITESVTQDEPEKTKSVKKLTAPEKLPRIHQRHKSVVNDSTASTYLQAVVQLNTNLRDAHTPMKMSNKLSEVRKRQKNHDA